MKFSESIGFSTVPDPIVFERDRKNKSIFFYFFMPKTGVTLGPSSALTVPPSDTTEMVFERAYLGEKKPKCFAVKNIPRNICFRHKSEEIVKNCKIFKK